MKIHEFIKNNRSYVFDTGLFLFILFIFSISLYYLEQLTQMYNNTQNQINATSITYQTNDATVNSFKKTNVSQNSLQAALPTQNTIIDWIKQTEQMAQNARVEQTLTFSGGQLTKNSIIVSQNSQIIGTTPSVEATILIKGTYNHILSYIALLNHSYYYTRINQISFSAGTSSTNNVMSTTPTPTTSTSVTASLDVNLFLSEATAQAPTVQH